MKKQANQLKKGNYFIDPEDNQPYLVESNEHSKSGKHGHAKNRVTAVSLFTKKRKSYTFTADEALDVPEILKKNAQLVDLEPEKKVAHVMDTESYETFECDYPLDEEDTVNLEKLRQLEENKDLLSTSQIEYWDVMGRKFITRVLMEK